LKKEDEEKQKFFKQQQEELIKQEEEKQRHELEVKRQEEEKAKQLEDGRIKLEEKQKLVQIRLDMEQKMRKEEEIRQFEEEKKRSKYSKREEREKQFLEEIRQAEEEVRRLETLKAEEELKYEKIKQQEEFKRKSYKEATPIAHLNGNESPFQERSSTQQTCSETTAVQVSQEVSVNGSHQETEQYCQESKEQESSEFQPTCELVSSPQEERRSENTKGRISQFQRSGSFVKSFTKTADIEMSQEFKAGIKGKVAGSKQSYLKQTSTDSSEQERLFRNQELENMRISRAQQEQENEEAESKDKQLREEKMRELEEIKRSRSHSRQRQEQTVLENSYSQEKESRANELAQLANRKTNCSWEIEDKEAQLREARAQELKMLSSRHTGHDWEPENKEQALREERAKELAEVANRKVDIDWDSQAKEYVLKQQRSEELAEIAGLRANTTWDNNGGPIDTSNSAENMETAEMSGINSETIVTVCEQQKATPISDSEMRSRVRNTKAAWQQKEKSASCERENSKPKDLPSRSIGNRFNKKSDFWNDTTDNDEFPEPPSEAEISASEDNSVSAPPPIAPRQSSKTVVKEYIESDPNWSAPWRKAT